MQKSISGHTLNLKAEDRTECDCCQLKNRTLRPQLWWAHGTLFDLMSLDLCCDIQIVGSEFGVNNRCCGVMVCVWGGFIGTPWAP